MSASSSMRSKKWALDATMDSSVHDPRDFTRLIGGFLVVVVTKTRLPPLDTIGVSQAGVLNTPEEKIPDWTNMAGATR